jgi:hypothetical protein
LIRTSSSTVFFALGLVLCTAIAACSGADDPQNASADNTASDEAALKAKTCGGIAGMTCPTGYECAITGKHPDATGTCKKKANSSCATMTCPAGQHCMVMGSPPAAMCM